MPRRSSSCSRASARRRAYARFDIPVVHDLPGVGENLQDHPGLAQTCFASVPTYNTLMGPIGALIYGAQWLLAGSGPASSPHSQVTAFLCHDMSEGRSDLQYMFTPAGYDLSADGPGPVRPAGGHGPHQPAQALLPRAGRAPLRRPARVHSTIQPNLFADERDLALLLAGAKLQRKLFQTEPLARSIAGDYRPSSDVQTDDEWRAYLRENSLSGYHPVGTCKMGRDDQAVVDHRLRVRGVENLLVADASIMPTIVSGNPLATCVMIGEKVAEMIRASA